MSFNTAVAQMMIFVNGMYESGCRSRAILEPFLVCLAPYAPHLAEELWHRAVVGATSDPSQPGYPFVSLAPWPAFDPALVVDDEIRMGVQVNGKHRGEIVLPVGAAQDVAVAAALANEQVRAAMEGKELKKTIYVAGRILNFVVG
jgi:leucyl-tRNA synthetase